MLDILRIHRLRLRSEAGQVGENHRHHLALAAHRPGGSLGSGTSPTRDSNGRRPGRRTAPVRPPSQPPAILAPRRDDLRDPNAHVLQTLPMLWVQGKVPTRFRPPRQALRDDSSTAAACALITATATMGVSRPSPDFRQFRDSRDLRLTAVGSPQRPVAYFQGALACSGIESSAGLALEVDTVRRAAERLTVSLPGTVRTQKQPITRTF